MLTPEQILTAELSDAQCLLYRFIQAVKSNNTPNDSDLKNISDCFQKILDGEEPKIALGLAGKQSSGRKPKTFANFNQEFLIVTEVLSLEGKKTKLPQAKKAIADKYGISVRTISNYFKDHESLARYIIEGGLETKVEKIKKMIDKFGEEIGDFPSTLVEEIFDNLRDAKPSEYVRIAHEVESAIKAKSGK